jgi:hypothetical protein
MDNMILVFKLNGFIQNSSSSMKGDTLSSSLIDSIMSPRQIQRKNEELGYVPWLATFQRVEGCAGVVG